jgi:hypothetical protein
MPLLDSLIGAIAGAAIAGFCAYVAQERKLRKDNELQDHARSVVSRVLNHPNWRLRTFTIIRHHLGGFDDDELRKLLVRSGALRWMSKSGYELWGLAERNKDRLERPRIDEDPANIAANDVFGGYDHHIAVPEPLVPAFSSDKSL